MNEELNTNQNKPKIRKKSDIVSNLFDITEVIVFAVVIAILMLSLIHI